MISKEILIQYSDLQEEVKEVRDRIDKTEKQIGGVRLGLVKKELITYEKVAGAGEDGKDLAYFVLTDKGANYESIED